MTFFGPPGAYLGKENAHVESIPTVVCAASSGDRIGLAIHVSAYHTVALDGSMFLRILALQRMLACSSLWHHGARWPVVV